jgi:aerobic C4-dicarboxylate transport protein
MTSPPRKAIYTSLYFQVLVGIALGVIFGFLAPEKAAAMKPLGDGFIKLVKMMITPIVFATVVVGIAHMGAMKDVGRIGLRALVYFEVVSTAALVIGLVVVTLLQPGAGIGFDPATADVQSVSQYAAASQHLSTVEFLLSVIPDTVVGAFARGDVLPVLLFSVLFGLALLRLGARVARVTEVIAMTSEALFEVIGLIMRLAPIGAFGAMAFTVGRYGIASLASLGKLMAGVYITCAFFVFIVLGAIAAATGFNILKFLKYIAEEILIVLGTSSSESALPRIMAKMEHLGCAKPVVGLVVPTGYSFNLDGTSIYMTMAAIFVAQASGVRDRQRLHHPGRNARRVSDDSGRRFDAAAGRRSLHVRSSRDYEPDRQRGRDRGDCEMGRGAGSRPRPPDPRRRNDVGAVAGRSRGAESKSRHGPARRFKVLAHPQELGHATSDNRGCAGGAGSASIRGFSGGTGVGGDLHQGRGADFLRAVRRVPSSDHVCSDVADDI